MNKILPVAILTAAFAGCRTPITPETSWSDYGRYYTPTGEKAEVSQDPANIQMLKTSQAKTTVASLQAQGYVVIGSFVIADDTDITYNAVAALAQKLNASAAIWTTENTIGADSALANPDPGIVGVDNMQLAQMNANRSDVSFAEQVITPRHTIWMLGKKAK